MSQAISSLTMFLSHHPEWTFFVMFATAFGESFVFLSILFPGTTIMIAAGLLVPYGHIPLLPLLLGGILGAVLGDGISYWIGRTYGTHLLSRWPLNRYPNFLKAAEISFRRYGTLSVFIGRFFGPLRATIPLVAGIMRMPRLAFWIANIASALIWAPALLLPGTLAIVLSDTLKIGEAYRPFAILGMIGVVVLAVWLIRKTRWIHTLSGDPNE